MANVFEELDYPPLKHEQRFNMMSIYVKMGKQGGVRLRISRDSSFHDVYMYLSRRMVLHAPGNIKLFTKAGELVPMSDSTRITTLEHAPGVVLLNASIHV